LEEMNMLVRVGKSMLANSTRSLAYGPTKLAV
jgi:hypothetical protein